MCTLTLPTVAAIIKLTTEFIIIIILAPASFAAAVIVRCLNITVHTLLLERGWGKGAIGGRTGLPSALPTVLLCACNCLAATIDKDACCATAG
jgi:hypothetical protein